MAEYKESFLGVMGCFIALVVAKTRASASGMAMIAIRVTAQWVQIGLNSGNPFSSFVVTNKSFNIELGLFVYLQ